MSILVTGGAGYIGSHVVSFRGQRIKMQMLRDFSFFTLGFQSFVNIGLHLKAVGIIVLDKLVGGIQYRLCGAVILGQCDLFAVGIDTDFVGVIGASHVLKLAL